MGESLSKDPSQIGPYAHEGVSQSIRYCGLNLPLPGPCLTGEADSNGALLLASKSVGSDDDVLANITMTRMTEIHVRERNQRVENAYLNLDPRIPVFCVSAKDYMTNAAGYRLNAVDTLPISAELSGIPSLKQFVANLAAQHLRKDLLNYVTITIPNFLASLGMACCEPIATWQVGVPGGLGVQLEVSFHH